MSSESPLYQRGQGVILLLLQRDEIPGVEPSTKNLLYKTFKHPPGIYA